jgi:hypothetical protein
MNYDEFRQQYERERPASVPIKKPPLDEYPGWLKWLCLVMFICASLVSGVHTTTMVRLTFSETLYDAYVLDMVSFAAFGALEIALFVTVFAWLRSFARWIPYVSTFVVFAVIVTANIADVARTYSGGDVASAAIVVGVGVGIPLTALLSGKLFVDIFRSKRTVHARTDEEYREALIAWDAQIQRAWKAYQKDGKPQTVKSGNFTNDFMNDFMKSGEGENKPRRRVKLHEVAREVHENGDENLSSGEMMEKYGISLGSTSKVREMVKSMNGHVREAGESS